MNTETLNLLLIDAHSTFDELQKVIDQARESQQRQLTVIETLERAKIEVEKDDYNKHVYRCTSLIEQALLFIGKGCNNAEYNTYQNLYNLDLPVKNTKYDKIVVTLMRDGTLNVFYRKQPHEELVPIPGAYNQFPTAKNIMKLMDFLYAKG